MSWEGTDLWTNQTNVINNGGGLLRRVSMDGLDDETYYDDLTATHHDFTVVPGGIVAALSWQPGSSEEPSEIIERLPDGTLQTVAVLDELAYLTDNYHANAIRYHAADGTYTVSDIAGILIKVDRMGNVLWQFGGSCAGAPAPKCVGGSFSHSHGHHLIDDQLVFFASTNTIYDYKLLESDASFTASELWSFTNDESSLYLGDATRLPNGNILMTVSSASEIVEVNAEKEVVQTLTTDYQFGYSKFRPTLYGPPTH